MPEPFSDDPTQWIFHGHPCGSVVFDEKTRRLRQGDLRTDAAVLHTAMARLLGYRWPAELQAEDDGTQTEQPTSVSKNEFALQGEETASAGAKGRIGRKQADPEAEELAPNNRIDLAPESWEWVQKCRDLLPLADEDGIVCIPPVRGEAAAAERLREMLRVAYGSAWSSASLDLLLQNAGHSGRDLDWWLREKFFEEHARLFGHRPFLWQIWDGRPDGFSAIVNYHKLDYRNLENLTYNYLGDWIDRQKAEESRKIDGADVRRIAAEQLQQKLALILEGEAPYDIFVRWKPLSAQAIGWNPDLNDGVRLNIRPFMTAGVLRHNKPNKLNIKWDKDRGKDVKSAPWYSLGAKYGGKEGDRINDHHLKLAEKRKAKQAAG